jgi:tripartite-type tricarboxylate transporter receptor subunit TctC
LKDFAPVINIGEIPSLLAAHPALPVKNVRELLQLAKTRKGELLYAASASSTYLATEMFKRMAGIEMTRVAYKGAGPAVIGLLSGEVQYMLGKYIAAEFQKYAKVAREAGIKPEWLFLKIV